MSVVADICYWTAASLLAASCLVWAGAIIATVARLGTLERSAVIYRMLAIGAATAAAALFIHAATR